MNTGVVKDSFKAVSYYLNKEEKRKAVKMFLLLFSSSLFDVFGLASIVPVLIAASEKTFIHENKYFSFLFNFFGFESEVYFLVFLILVVLLIFILKTVYLVLVNYGQAKFIASIGLKISERQFVKYSNLPYLEFSKIGTPGVINQVLTTPNVFIIGIIRQCFSLLTETVNTIIILIVLLVFNPLLVVLLGLILGPCSYLIYKGIRNRSYKIGKELNIKKPAAHMIISDAFMGFVEMKLANKEDFFRKRLVENQRSTHVLTEQVYLFTFLPSKILEVNAVLGVVLIFLYSFLVADSASILAIVGLFAAAAYRLMPSINKLLQALIGLKSNQYSIDNLRLYEEYEEHKVSTLRKERIAFNEKIEIKDLSFLFPDSDVKTLNSINIKINKGDRIGFVGPSGSGKSTLMSIILRFLREQNGGIFVDGIKLEDRHTQSWRSHIGYVKQDVFIMNGTIKDNIVIGDNVVDEKRLMDAIEKASLNSFIASLPNGVDTVIAERGANLSGGQRQRIGIARALYRESDVLILDEATSALDNETEKEVSEAIDNLARTDVTILIVAHRITTLKGCDRIYKLSNGRVEGEYDYEEIFEQTINS